jgi:hypothetical protein
MGEKRGALNAPRRKSEMGVDPETIGIRWQPIGQL